MTRSAPELAQGTGPGPPSRAASKAQLRRQDRTGRIVHLVASAYALEARQLRSRPRFHPSATLARMVAITLARDLLNADLEFLARYFGDDTEAIAAACNRTAERCARDPTFKTTIQFLKSSATALLSEREVGGE